MASITLRAPEPAMAFEQLSIDNTSGGVGLTVSKYNPAPTSEGSRSAGRFATISIEGNQIRACYFPGTAPTTSVGHLYQIGDTIELNSFAQIQNFRAIRVGATTATIFVTYWGS